MPTDKPIIAKKEALGLITHFCSREERCISEVKTRLNQFGLPEIDIEEIIEFLKSEKYIDDQRYANAYANDKFRFNKWGKYKITMFLKQKHITGEYISNAIENIPFKDYKELLVNELRKKMSQLAKASKFETKGKLYRFAAQRGFENDLIIETLNELLDNIDN
jgi:regulatory protein